MAEGGYDIEMDPFNGQDEENTILNDDDDDDEEDIRLELDEDSPLLGRFLDKSIDDSEEISKRLSNLRNSSSEEDEAENFIKSIYDKANLNKISVKKLGDLVFVSLKRTNALEFIVKEDGIQERYDKKPSDSLLKALGKKKIDRVSEEIIDMSTQKEEIENKMKKKKEEYEKNETIKKLKKELKESNESETNKKLRINDEKIEEFKKENTRLKSELDIAINRKSSSHEEERLEKLLRRNDEKLNEYEKENAYLENLLKDQKLHIDGRLEDVKKIRDQQDQIEEIENELEEFRQKYDEELETNTKLLEEINTKIDEKQLEITGVKE